VPQGLALNRASPIAMSARARTRFDVTLNERLAQDFDSLARTEGVNRAEIFKRALAAYKVLKQEENKGSQILIREDGQMDRRLIAL